MGALSNQTSNTGDGQLSARIDTTVTHPARRYNYWLGGKDHFAADRASGDQIAALYPAVRITARENRFFLQRAVRFLATEAGVHQFLDIGTGIPSANNTHEVAQAITPDSRVVYVDNDPIVLTHARALLTSTPQGATAYIDADLRDPERILHDVELRNTLDLSKPVALMLIAVAHFLEDTDRPYEIVSGLLDALPSGSYLVMSHATMDLATPELRAHTEAEIAAGRVKFDWTTRNREEFGAFFNGLELLDPGIVSVVEWRPELPESERPSSTDASIYAAVARKP